MCRYGDRAPKSLQGRAFAVIWILIGICIISIFTATLTTSLTTVSLENKISLPGSKVTYYFTALCTENEKKGTVDTCNAGSSL